MCGIAGIIAIKGMKITTKDLDGLQSAMLHRGPDGEGSFVEGRVGLTMRRLSIIDISGGDQPLNNEDGNVVVVGNGEIYNFVELQKELVSKGHHLSTKSDIETVVHLYEEFGLEFVDKLRGMFALAIYDKVRRRVVLVRDRLGEKPLYWTKTRKGYIFASEMKALISMKGVKRRLNKSAIDQYFHYYYIPEPETAFLDVHKLPPANMLVIDLKTMKVKQDKYWCPEKISPTDEGIPTGKIRKIFSQSCLLTLRSDVPVGIALSGGIDSGSILSFAAPAYKKNIKAFSIGYEGTPPSDERGLAKKLAKKYGVEFIEKEIKVKEIIDHFPRLVYEGDDPIADIAAHSIYSVSKLARDNNVPVLLGGLGGDELFWGYDWLHDAVKHSIDQLSSPLGFLRKKISFYDLNPGFKTAEMFIKHFYTREFKNEIGLNSNHDLMSIGFPRSELNIAKKGLDLIRDVWLVSNCIDLNDRLSMANSVELRSPFLDYKLHELILSSKELVLAYDKPQKYWLKKAMKGILPDEVMNRRKQGFTPPVANWIKGILQRYLYLLKDGFLIKENIFSRRSVDILLSTWMGIPMHWYALYQIILLEIWGREYYYDQSPEELR